jgi:cysteine-rich repeat protein
MTRTIRILAAMLGAAAGAACGSVVQDEPDGQGEVSDTVEAEVPPDVRTDDAVDPDEGTVADVPDVPETVDVADTADVPEAEAGCTGSEDCDDGEPCNGLEQCESETCVAGEPPVEGSACTLGAFHGVCTDGLCTPPHCPDGDVDTADGEECDDGAAVPGDGCEPNCRFTCHANTDCADENPCTVDLCRPNSRGQACQYTPATSSTPCDDGDPCTVEDHCNDTTCVAGEPRRCDDLDECTADRCDATVEGTADYPCVYTPLPVWYRDQDGDLWGVHDDQRCQATQPSGYVHDPGDCCDDDVDVHPVRDAWEATSYRCDDSADPSFDWNCSGAAELEWPSFAVGTCRVNAATGACTGLTTPGWCPAGTTPPAGSTCGAIPTCGSSAGWIEACDWITVTPTDVEGLTETLTDSDIRDEAATDISGSVCGPRLTTRVQRCR